MEWLHNFNQMFAQHPVIVTNALNEKATVAVIGEGDLPSGRAYINDYMTVVSADEPPAKPTIYEISQLRHKKWR